ncbi:beta-ketoacyl-[acyl-carrier-protein] synthase family protein [Paucidesulfovibrio longus]|uniref:beta-ketoacyl-[acyl-carrier-protein] synthase family protein n=1 Tax=Paucidesulfovibrio longus TaxID=889 RepID=UPI0003B6DA48|nr:beta-ketoacyl-[acyl-carrier-protein] synthase family protein [Paucidesulfovibrio longus]
MTDRPVAVTGLGCVSACGLNLAENTATLFGAPPAPRPPERFTCGHETSYPVFAVPEAFFERHPREPELFDTSLFALAAAQEAFNSAGLPQSRLPGLRVGVCIGTTVGASLNFQEYYRRFKSGENPGPVHIRRYLESNPARVLATRFGLSGPAQTVVNACSSGTDAIGIGAGWIRQGLCDIALVGGADELTPITYNGFISLQITSEGPCRPFDALRNGLNLGEGAGMLVLESQKHAASRRAPLRGGVLGYGTCADAHHLTAPRPDGQGLCSALRDAVQRSDIEPREIGFVNVHGTATTNNDVAEGAVLFDLFPHTPLSATKGCTGHTLGAAGALEAIFTLVCLHREELPASKGCEQPDPACRVSPVRERTACPARYALSQSLAFGGNNSALVFRREDA